MGLHHARAATARGGTISQTLWRLIDYNPPTDMITHSLSLTCSTWLHHARAAAGRGGTMSQTLWRLIDYHPPTDMITHILSLPHLLYRATSRSSCSWARWNVVASSTPSIWRLPHTIVRPGTTLLTWKRGLERVRGPERSLSWPLLNRPWICLRYVCM